MSNLMGIVLGLVAILVGLILIVAWWSMFVKALMAVVPILLIVIGAAALLYFISEIKSKKAMEAVKVSSPETRKEEK